MPSRALRHAERPGRLRPVPGQRRGGTRQRRVVRLRAGQRGCTAAHARAPGPLRAHTQAGTRRVSRTHPGHLGHPRPGPGGAARRRRIAGRGGAPRPAQRAASRRGGQHPAVHARRCVSRAGLLRQPGGLRRNRAAGARGAGAVPGRGAHPGLGLDPAHAGRWRAGAPHRVLRRPGQPRAPAAARSGAGARGRIRGDGNHLRQPATPLAAGHHRRAVPGDPRDGGAPRQRDHPHLRAGACAGDPLLPAPRHPRRQHPRAHVGISRLAHGDLRHRDLPASSGMLR